ncbi:hypothetical protein PGB90_000778 [Kerria lacca]
MPLSVLLCVLDLCFLTINNGNSTMDVTQASSMTDRLDALNIDEVLKNTRLFNSYVKCMLETGPCTAEGRELKREVLEVLHTACSNCTSKTKTRLKKTFLRLKSDSRFRESYKRVLEKYDPDKKYIVNLEKFLN